MLFKKFLLILVYLLVLITFLHAATWSRLCDRMTSCDILRFVRTHKKQITTVNEKTKRVDFLTKELQIGGEDLTRKIDILEGRYQNLSEEGGSFFRPCTTDDKLDFTINEIDGNIVQLRDIITDSFDDEKQLIIEAELEHRPDETNGDYEESIMGLNKVHKAILDNFTDVENELEDLKERVIISISGAKVQTHDLHGIKEDVDRGEDMLKSLEIILQNHFEEIELIRDFHTYDDAIISIDFELNELDKKYSEIQSEIEKLLAKTTGETISKEGDFQESNDTIRYARDELKSLKLSMSKLIKAVNDAQDKCINGGLNLDSKMHGLYRRIKNVGSRKVNCKG